jgi:hypothetical protein
VCKWIEYGQQITQTGDQLTSDGITPGQVRFQLYRLFTRLDHGVLTAGDRRELPACVEDSIKEHWPNNADAGNYVGFRAV